MDCQLVQAECALTVAHSCWDFTANLDMPVPESKLSFSSLGFYLSFCQNYKKHVKLLLSNNQPKLLVRSCGLILFFGKIHIAYLNILNVVPMVFIDKQAIIDQQEHSNLVHKPI